MGQFHLRLPRVQPPGVSTVTLLRYKGQGAVLVGEQYRLLEKLGRSVRSQVTVVPRTSPSLTAMRGRSRATQVGYRRFWVSLSTGQRGYSEVYDSTDPGCQGTGVGRTYFVS